MDEMISKQAAIDEVDAWLKDRMDDKKNGKPLTDRIKDLPSVPPERLTDSDFEAIRIHLTAIKEELCNQHRWKEAEDYERLINRFMSFASTQQEQWSRQLVYHQDNVNDLRSKFVGIVVKHF